MKKLSLVIILVACTTFVKAQITGGGAVNRSNDSEKKESTSNNNSDANKWKAMTLGLFMPTGDFGLYNASANRLESAIGANTGFGGEINSYNFFYETPSKIKVGLYSSFAIAIHFMNPEWTDDDNTYLLLPPIYAEFKLGPVVSYEIINGISVDAYIKGGPVVVAGPIFEYDNFNTSEYYNFGYDGVGLGILRFAFGANIRTSNMLFGFSVNPQSIDRTFFVDEDDIRDERMPLGTTRLLVGFKF
jgi:hypothetical protein